MLLFNQLYFAINRCRIPLNTLPTMKKTSHTTLSTQNTNPKGPTQKKGPINNNKKTKNLNNHLLLFKPSPFLQGKNKMLNKSETLDTLLLLSPKNLEKATIMIEDQGQEECNNILR